MRYDDVVTKKTYRGGLGSFWFSDEYDSTKVRHINVNRECSGVNRNRSKKFNGLSVRCIKDL